MASQPVPIPLTPEMIEILEKAGIDPKNARYFKIGENKRLVLQKPVVRR